MALLDPVGDLFTNLAAWFLDLFNPKLGGKRLRRPSKLVKAQMGEFPFSTKDMPQSLIDDLKRHPHIAIKEQRAFDFVLAWNLGSIDARRASINNRRIIALAVSRMIEAHSAKEQTQDMSLILDDVKTLKGWLENHNYD